MRSILSVSPVVRAVGVIGAVSVLATSVTFAALQSQATLADDTISSATANLVIDANNDNTFGASESGFHFTGIVPGTTDSTVGSFKLRNGGDTALDVSVALTGTPTILPADVDQTKVHFVFHNTAGTGGTDQNVTLAALVAGNVPFVTNMAANPSASLDYDVKVSVDADAFSGENFSVSSFNLVFTGKPHSETP